MLWARTSWTVVIGTIVPPPAARRAESSAMAAPLLVLTGPPGAGTSTVAAAVDRFPKSALVEVDASLDRRHVLHDPPDDIDATASRILDALACGSLRHPVR